TRFTVIELCAANDDELVNRERHSLPELIAAAHHIHHELSLQWVQRIVVAITDCIAHRRRRTGRVKLRIKRCRWIIRLNCRKDRRRVELFVDPTRQTNLLHATDISITRSPRGLLKEAQSILRSLKCG